MEHAKSAVCYAVDPKASRFVVRVFAGGILASLGHSPTIAIRDYEGELQCVSGRMEESSFRASIRTDSFAVIDDISERDRREIQATMHEKVLETQKFPDITFESSQIISETAMEGLFRVLVVGSLKLHGVTRKQRISAQITSAENTLRASGEFTLNQSDFNIKLYAFAAGALKLKDELKFSFDLVARRKK